MDQESLKKLRRSYFDEIEAVLSSAGRSRELFQDGYERLAKQYFSKKRQATIVA